MISLFNGIFFLIFSIGILLFGNLCDSPGIPILIFIMVISSIGIIGNLLLLSKEQKRRYSYKALFDKEWMIDYDQALKELEE